MPITEVVPEVVPSTEVVPIAEALLVTKNLSVVEVVPIVEAVTDGGAQSIIEAIIGTLAI